MADNKIYLIGGNHGVKEFFDLKRKLCVKASVGLVVLGLESLVRDESQEKRHVRDFYGIESGLLYGIEDELPLCASQILSGYLVFGFDPEDGKQEFRRHARTGQLLIDLQNLPLMRELWQEAASGFAEVATTSLFLTVDRIIKGSYRIPQKIFMGLVSKIAGDLNGESTLEIWEDVYRKLGNAVIGKIQEMPAEERPDMVLLRNYFENRPSVGDETAMAEIGCRWRNGFLSRNMDYVVERGRLTGNDVYFLVGFAHTEGLFKDIRQKHPSIPSYVWVSEDGIPKEARHLLQT